MKIKSLTEWYFAKRVSQMKVKTECLTIASIFVLRSLLRQIESGKSINVISYIASTDLTAHNWQKKKKYIPYRSLPWKL